MKSKNNSQDLGLDLNSFSIGWKKPRQRDAKPDVKPSQPPGPRLKDCLDLIIEKADEIIHTPEYFWCRPWESYWMRMYLGRFDLPLGVLAAKWASGELAFPYGQNKRNLYVYSSMGSPLSGSGMMRGMLKNDDGYSVVTHNLSHKDLPSDISISLSQTWLNAKNEYGGVGINLVRDWFYCVNLIDERRTRWAIRMKIENVQATRIATTKRYPITRITGK